METLMQTARTLAAGGEAGRLARELFSEASTQVLKENQATLPALLDSLDPTTDSLFATAALNALNTSGVPTGPALEQRINVTTQLFLSFNAAQAKTGQEHITKLASAFSDQAVAAKQPLRAVLPLKTIIEKAQSSPEHVTSMHEILIKTCLLAKAYGVARAVLDTKKLSLDAEANKKLSIDQVLKYFYYGGMVYTGLKQFDKALQFYSVAICAPAETVSAIALEAYKKFLLVSLLRHASVQPLPKFTNFIIRYFKQQSKPYQEFATAFGSGQLAQLDKEITTHQATFQEDNNFGLIKQCRIRLIRENIRKLTGTFLTLPLAEIAKRVSLGSAAEAEHHLVQMIAQGQIFATINQQSGIVSFKDDPEEYDTAQTLTRLNAQAAAAAQLAAKIKSLDSELRVDPKLIRKLTPASDPLGAGPHAMELDFDDTFPGGK